LKKNIRFLNFSPSEKVQKFLATMGLDLQKNVLAHFCQKKKKVKKKEEEKKNQKLRKRGKLTPFYP